MADVVGSGSAEAQTDIERQIAIAQTYNSPVDAVNAILGLPVGTPAVNSIGPNPNSVATAQVQRPQPSRGPAPRRSAPVTVASAESAGAAPKASAINTAVPPKVINTLSDGSWVSRMEHEIELSFRGNYLARNMIVQNNEGRAGGLVVGARGKATKDGPVGRGPTFGKTGAPPETSRER